MTWKRVPFSGGDHAIEFADVAKTYAGRRSAVRALRALTMRVVRGGSAALVGPNGSGKTTALKIAAALVEPSSGSASVSGHDVVREPGAVRGIVGASFGSQRSFYWRITARQNLLFFALLKGVSIGRSRGHVEDVAEELALGDVLDVPARMLSRGSLGRLAVARALLGRPRVLILDEPFAALDMLAQELVWDAVGRRLSAGSALLVATHSLEVASRCDEVIRLRAGERCLRPRRPSLRLRQPSRAP